MFAMGLIAPTSAEKHNNKEIIVITNKASINTPARQTETLTSAELQSITERSSSPDELLDQVKKTV